MIIACGERRESNYEKLQKYKMMILIPYFLSWTRKILSSSHYLGIFHPNKAWIPVISLYIPWWGCLATYVINYENVFRLSGQGRLEIFSLLSVSKNCVLQIFKWAQFKTQEVFSLKRFPKWLSYKSKQILWESNKLFKQRQ